MATTQTTALADLFKPGVWALKERAAAQVEQADVHQVRDYVTDITKVYLDVRHVLITIKGSPTEALRERLNLHLIGERMERAMLAAKPAPKIIAIERRKMLWRGRQQRIDKPKRVKSARRRVA